MTFDKGKEFSGHQKLADILGVSCFFANRYHSWERGLNEHTNGLLRQFFSKGTNFKIVRPEALKYVVDLLITDRENLLTIERLTKYVGLNHQHLLHFRFELAIELFFVPILILEENREPRCNPTELCILHAP